METGVWCVERKEGGRASFQYLQVLDWLATAACLCTQTGWYMVTYVQDGSETPTHALLTLYLSLFTTLLLLTFHYFNTRCRLNDTIYLSALCSSLPHFSPIRPSRVLCVRQLYLRVCQSLQSLNLPRLCALSRCSDRHTWEKIQPKAQG